MQKTAEKVAQLLCLNEINAHPYHAGMKNEYSFKYNCRPVNIINSFQGERKDFVTTIIKHCLTKKIWTIVDIQGILNNYNTDRKRIIIALEYFEEKGWIELQARQAIEIYDIKTQAFNLDTIAENWKIEIWERLTGWTGLKCHCIVN